MYLVNTSTNDPTHQYSWSFGDGNYANGRTPSHRYLNYGAHEVCLTITDSSMNCTSTYCDTVGLDSSGQIVKSSGYTIKVLEGDFIGVEEKTILKNLSLYPNPFKETIQVSMELDPNATYQVYTINGQLLAQGKLNYQEIRLTEIRPGIYFIRIESDGKSITKKVIKQ